MDLLTHGTIEKRSKLTFMIISGGKEFFNSKDLASFTEEIITFSSSSQYNQYKINRVNLKL